MPFLRRFRPAKPPKPTTPTPSTRHPPRTKIRSRRPFPGRPPDGSSADHPSDSDQASPNHSTTDDNPFPESVSRDAAKAAGNDSAPAPAERAIFLQASVRASPVGWRYGENEPDAATSADPARAKKDTEVAGFYLKTGDYQGALLRYKDATTADPTNVEAIFGLAETQRMLKKNAEAARNYQLYLEIVPNGPKAKQALKALKTLRPRWLIPRTKVVVPSEVHPTFWVFSPYLACFTLSRGSEYVPYARGPRTGSQPNRQRSASP